MGISLLTRIKSAIHILPSIIMTQSGPNGKNE
jgi:hypothetical protein